MAVTDLIDFERYVRDQVAVTNDDGRRGRERGVLVFCCPLCKDERARGFVNLEHRTAGCFNSGCVAEPRLRGGLVEWAGAIERTQSRIDTIQFLLANYRRTGLRLSVPHARQIAEYDDWARLPKDTMLFCDKVRRTELPYVRFAKRQWGLEREDLANMGFGYCLQGKYHHRIIIPVVMRWKVVGFQARTIQSDAEPKYLNARRGERTDERAECGRAAEAWVYNIDTVRERETVILVEGAPDAVRYNRDNAGRGVAVAIMGVNLTTEKVGLIAKKHPRRVLVALDNDDAARRRARVYVEGLIGWGLDATQALWVGGKDAGEGAQLVEQSSSLARRIGGDWGAKEVRI